MDSVPPVDIMNWVKDLGLPVVGLYYLFKLYTKALESSSIREDKYATILAEQSKQWAMLHEQLTNLATQFSNMAEQYQIESAIRQELLDKLVETVLTNQNRGRTLGAGGG